jgi:excisionase family DNA binding protein
MQAEIVREWLTYREAEQLVGLSRTTLWKLIGAGEIEYRRVGRAVRINRESLDAYMRGDTEDGAPRPSARTE